jgi:hypothetical protein
MTVGGVDTYYDYEKQRWMHRRLGGGPVRPEPPEADEAVNTAAAGYRRGKAVAPPEEPSGRQSGKVESSEQGGIATRRR